ncbi:MAG: DsbC family protein [Mariprofundus sp.]
MRSLLLILGFLIATPAMAADSKTTADIEAIRSHANQVLRQVSVDAVQATPIPGLYEVRSGRNIFYSDADGSHFVIGAHIIDAVSKKDLTQARQEELNRVDWSVLPLDKAVISGDKDATLKLAVFTDPECPYCRKFEKNLEQLKGVKIYNFLFPLSFHKHAKRWSSAIWCSKDQHKMMTDIMINNADPKAGSCATPIDEIIALAQKLGISGTPTLISGDGRLSPGGKPLAELNSWLQIH